MTANFTHYIEAVDEDATATPIAVKASIANSNVPSPPSLKPATSNGRGKEQVKKTGRSSKNQSNCISAAAAEVEPCDDQHQQCSTKQPQVATDQTHPGGYAGETIRVQELVINRLQCQLEFATSFVGINDANGTMC